MARKTTPLSDTEIRKAKALEKDYKLYDGHGLFLLVKKTGTKIWRFEYKRPYTDKRTMLSLGHYPVVTLSEARKVRDEYRGLLLKQIDLSAFIENKYNKNKEKLNNTFASVAQEWLDKQSYKESTYKKTEIYIGHANKVIGKKPVSEVTSQDVINACLPFETQGKHETANRIKIKITQILSYATATGKTKQNVAVGLSGVLKQPKVQNRKAITEPEAFARLLVAIQGYNGSVITKSALKLAYLTFVRPGELRNAKWADIDLQEKLWCFTPPKTEKDTGIELVVPLATQAVSVLTALKAYSTGQYVFPALTKDVPMSDNTVNKAIKTMGFLSVHTGHGFRASARTMLEEVLEYEPKYIEMQLGHKVKDANGTAYNRTKFINKRIEMMQAWADFCDSLMINPKDAETHQ